MRNGLRRLTYGVVLLLANLVRAEDGATTSSVPAESRLSAQLRVTVREFRFKGNTVFSTQELSKIVAPYVGREITSDELEQARRALTEHYINAGFINSGAILEDQPVKDGSITFTIIEGILSSIELEGNKWLRSGYIHSRLRIHDGPPLNMEQLKQGLQLLRQNPNVKQVNAELRPGVAPGESVLMVRVKDQHPFRLGLEIANDRPPSVGAEEIRVHAADINVTGYGDVLGFTYGIAHTTAKIVKSRSANGVERDSETDFDFSGIENFSAFYTLPITPYETTLSVFGGRNDYAVIQEPFSGNVITSESRHFGATLRQPLYRTANREFAVSLTAERRESETFLFGVPADITPGSVNGRTKITALRFTQEWIDRTQDHVLALRSTFNWGIDAFGVTDAGTNAPDIDATFVSWQGQFQYVQRLFHTANQMILRSNVQFSDDPLLSLEQLSVGGANTVRGYRENAFVRDQGVTASIEFRVPVLYDKAGNGIIQLAPFFDFGAAWNVDAKPNQPQTLYSAGIGILVSPNRHIDAQLYWGYGFRDFDTPEDDLQDAGIHFRVNFELF